MTLSLYSVVSDNFMNKIIVDMEDHDEYLHNGCGVLIGGEIIGLKLEPDLTLQICRTDGEIVMITLGTEECLELKDA